MRRYLKHLFFFSIVCLFIIPNVQADLIVDTGAPNAGITYVEQNLGFQHAAQFTLPDGDWSELSISSYFKTEIPANLRADLHMNGVALPQYTGPVPGDLIASGIKFAMTTSNENAWVELPLNLTTTLPGGNYWITFYLVPDDDPNTNDRILVPTSWTPTAEFTPLTWYAFHTSWDGGSWVPVNNFGNAFGVRVTANPVAEVSFSCIGFEPPMDKPVGVHKKNRVLPLKMELRDQAGVPITGLNASPLVEVDFSGGGSATDPADTYLPAGQGDEGNQFVFTDSKWQFNLQTVNFSGPGTYTIKAISGDPDEYLIDPTCTATFVIE